MSPQRNLIPGPWPVPAQAAERPVRLERSDGTVLDAFADFETAIRYREEQELGTEWEIRDARGEPTDLDRMLLLGMVLRDHLRSIWRHKQFDLLLHGEVRKLPSVSCDGLQDLSALSAAAALNEAGHDNWRAVTGLVHTGGASTKHAWLEREDGLILDFMADRFGRGPLALIEPHDRQEARYEATGSLAGHDEWSPWTERLPSKISAILPEPERDLAPAM